MTTSQEAYSILRDLGLDVERAELGAKMLAKLDAVSGEAVVAMADRLAAATPAQVAEFEGYLDRLGR